MDTKYIFTILVLLTSSFYEVASRPSQSESFPLADGQTFEQPDTIQDEIGRSAPPINIPDGEEITKNILDKINFVNKGLTRPHRQQFGVNNAQNINLEIDEELLAKIQDLITSGKINGFSDLKKQTVNNGLDDERTRVEYAKKLLHTQGNQLSTAPANIMYVSLPYIVGLPIITPSAPMSPVTNFQDLNSSDNNGLYSSRQGFPMPNIPWPFAPFFPVHIIDPLQAFLSGSSFIEYGPAADVCRRNQKSNFNSADVENEIEKYHSNQLRESNLAKSRQTRATNRRNISTKSTPGQKSQNKIDKNDKTKNDPKKFFSKPVPVVPVKRPVMSHHSDKYPVYPFEAEQDLRFGNVGDIGWFWRKKPPPPNPGFFINRLKVKKGGVAIAGPGGVATAGNGGAAIVGPGGLAYTQPGGLAVAGPAARVVALSSDADLSSVVTRLREQAAEDGSVPRLLESIPEGKVVATGPVVYYHPTE